jgi:hypothetical protein
VVKPELARICLFPIKSLDGVVVEAAEVLPGGALAFDRRWRMVDRQGRTVNGKRTAAVHQVAARFDVQRELVWLDARGGSQPRAYHLVEEWPAIQRRLSELLDIEITLQKMPERVSGRSRRAWPDGGQHGDAGSSRVLVPRPDVGSGARAVPHQSGNRGRAAVLGRSIDRGRRRRGPVLRRGRQALGGQAVRTLHRADSIRRDGRIHYRFRSRSSRSAANRRCRTTLRASRFDDFYRLAVNTRRRPPLEKTPLRVGDQVVRE